MVEYTGADTLPSDQEMHRVIERFEAALTAGINAAKANAAQGAAL